LLLYFKDGLVTRKVFLLNISTKKIKIILETSGLQSFGYKSLSSDGKNLLYHDENGYLSMLNIRTGGKKELISTSAGLNPTWSPDDNSIVFRELDDNLYIIDSEGLNKRILFSQKRERGYLVHDVESWSPDGKYVLFSLEPGDRQFSGGILHRKYPKYLVMNIETKENLEIEKK
jgi:Tol biopolymer transport system component